jgi:hypothetical protein
METMGEVISALLYCLAALAFYMALRSHLAWRAERRVANTLAAVPPLWSLALLVDVDEEGGELSPIVQIRRGPKAWTPWIRLELVDAEGLIRSRTAQPLPLSAIGAELKLPPFSPPGGTSAEEALGWHWDIVVYDREREYARWREHPRRAGLLNAEGELEWPV